LKCIDLIQLIRRYNNLQKVILTQSHVEFIFNCQLEVSSSQGVSDSTQKDTLLDSTIMIFESIEILDLSQNLLKTIEKVFLERFPNIRELNLSGNSIASLDFNVFSNLNKLQVLDLASNKLNHGVDPYTFLTLPPGLQHIDISGSSNMATVFSFLMVLLKYVKENLWTCSPNLAWMYNWSIPLVKNGFLAKANSTR